MNPKLKKIFTKPFIYKNKYWLTLLGFFIWILFFDQYDLKTIIKLQSQKNKIKKDQVYYEKQIDDSKKELHELTSDENQLEKFAREKYLMKRDDEDVFVIIKEEK